MSAAAIACTECRRSHVKCNVEKPACGRCVSSQLECVYVPSRRGGRRIPRNRLNTSMPRQVATAPTGAPSSLTTTAARRDSRGTSEPHARSNGRDGDNRNRPVELASMPKFSSPNSQHSARESCHSASLGRPQQPFVPEARLVHLYYEHFHKAHPFLAPASRYERRRYPDYLHQVVRFVGASYSKVLCGDDFLEQAALGLSGADRSPAMVQALLLFSIIMSARNDRAEAVTALSRAIDLALELKMYQADFAERFSNEQEWEAESLRRTWWELFIWEVFMALPEAKISLRCSDAGSQVYVPCEESTYALGKPLPTPQTFSAFRGILFDYDCDSDDETDNDAQDSSDADLPTPTQPPCSLSSYSFRIEAFHILARVLVINTMHDSHPDHLQSVANMIVSWGHLLPPSKIDIVDMYGNIDEMLFQAQFVVHYASTLLHVPRSNLRLRFPDPSSDICPETPVRLSPSLTRHVHDVKAIEASKELSNLLSVHSRPQGCSPLVVPGTVLCGLVQLAASEVHSSECAEHHLNRAVLALGTLRIHRRHWRTAHKAYKHLKMAASATRAADPPSSTRAAGRRSAQRQRFGQGQEDYRPSANGADAEVRSRGNEIAINMDGNTVDLASQFLMPGLLSPYVDASCSEPLGLYQFSDFEYSCV